jgi:tetratricopeptide (TPR) repeat protein
MRLAALALAASLRASPLPDAVALTAEGDRHFALRAQGAEGARCDPTEVDAALDSYRRAVAADPDSVRARSGVLRSLFFRSGFCGEDAAAQKRAFEEAKRFADESQGRLERLAGAKVKGNRPAPFGNVEGAPALLFWCALSWGQWSLDHKVAAAWQGAGGRIRDLAEAAVALAPGYEEGAPHIVLGRLHTESPRIPLVTGFVSRKKGLAELRKACALAPTNTVAQWFLAGAILAHDPARRAEALRLLRACAAASPRPDYLVEDRHYAQLARERLRALGEEP